VGAAPGYALRVTHSAKTSTEYLINIFAQLDAHNFDPTSLRVTNLPMVLAGFILR